MGYHALPECVMNKAHTIDLGINSRDIHSCEASTERPPEDVDALIPDMELTGPIKEARRVRFSEQNEVRHFQKEDPIIVVHHREKTEQKHDDWIIRLPHVPLQSPSQGASCKKPTYFLEMILTLILISGLMMLFKCPCYSLVVLFIALATIICFSNCLEVYNKA